MGLKSFARLLAVSALFGAAGLAFSSQAPRIAAVDASQTARLAGNVAPRALIAEDQGLAPADKPLQGMALRFCMTAAQQAALSQLLIDQQNPASPRYQQWLTPEQFRAQFGLSASDIAKVTAWLTSQGFTVTETSRSGLFVRFSGTVAQAQKAFSTEIHQVSLRGETHVSNLTEPALPAAIAAVTSNITGLDDFRPKPHHSKVTTIPGNSAQSAEHPGFTSSISGNHYLAPGDFYAIYDEAGVISSGVTGAGTTIAVVGQTDVYLSDVAAFRSASGLTVNQPTVQLYGTDPGMPSTDDLIEASLDLEWSGAAAPGANILFVNSTNAIDGSLTEAIDNNLAPIISTSYGDCEPDLGVAYLANFSQILQMASAEGIAITSASGDDGATDCDYQSVTAQGGLAVDFPGASPMVTSVGGTEFNEGAGTYWSTTNGAYSGSALSYIPEVVWNEDSSNGLSASGGGRSAYFTKPAWQTGAGVPADFARDVPDVALNASPDIDPYLICVQGSCVNGYRNSSQGLTVVGGTSVGAPSFAGVLALVQQKTGARLGNANPKIYALANSTYVNNVFHDIIAGTNASPCVAGTPNCAAGGPIGFAATSNYDLATGWGSIDVMNLVNDWALVTPVATTTGPTATITNLSGSASSVPAGTTITLTASVTPYNAAGSLVTAGSVQFTVDNVAVGSAVALSSSGQATYALNTSSIASGQHTVQAAYTGSGTYAGSIGAFSVNITSTTVADFTLTPSTATVTVASGGTAPGVVFTVGAVNGFTGNVTFTASASASLNAEYSFSTSPVVITSTATTGTTTLTLFAYTSSAQTGQAPFLRRASAQNKQRNALYGAGSGVTLAGLLLLLFPSRRRRLSSLLLLVLLAGAGFGITGCSNGVSGVNSTVGNTGTTEGTYSIVVTGTGSVNGVATSHSSNVTLVVH